MQAPSNLPLTAHPEMAEKNRFKNHLEKVYRTFGTRFLSSDPLEYVHRFKTRRDREITGLIASSLAYGQVRQIKKTIESVLDVMGWEPYSFTVNFRPSRDKRLFGHIRHRFNSGKDIGCLIYFAKQIFDLSGSIEGFFLKGYSTADKNVKNALTSFSQRVLELDSGGIYGRKKLPARAGVRFFFPSPSGGGPCKRLNLYLRWMVRRGDALDFGLWKKIDPSKLVIPLDTHIARISRNIGLAKRATPDWKMAEEITEGLKELDPLDPVKYDFAISRLGILDECSRRADPGKCQRCMIKGLCVL
jgi:uncharacterized protein (TIGR02757 family)